MHKPPGCGFQVCKCPHRIAGHDGRTQHRKFLAAQLDVRNAQHVGLDLVPQLAGRAATDDARLAERQIGQQDLLDAQVEGVFVGDSF